MGLLKLFFRAARISKRRTSRRTSVVITSKRTVYQSNETQLSPVSESQKVRSAKDVERIQTLPSFKVEHVIDGDTVIVASTSSQLKVRLDSIDCPEHGQEWGDIATRGLIKLIGGKSVKLEVHGSDAYGRMLGTLFVYLQNKGEWQNVNERMVTFGHAWVMRLYYGHLPKPRQQKLNQLERWAKSKSVGLWKTESPTPPWKWRKS
jgi:endonuclease YncB( thermonuclease family)